MDNKIVYNIDAISRAFIGEQKCYKTSLDPDTWHWAGLAMEMAPPNTGANEIAVGKADMSDWEVKSYFVGITYWLEDGSEHEITEIGVAPPNGALFEKPVVPEPPKTVFTSLEFLDKFTEVEQLAVAGAAMADVTVKIWYDKLMAASYVDLADPRILGGLNALVAKDLLDEARVAVIMTPEEPQHN